MQDENAPTVKYYDIVYGFKINQHLPLELELITSTAKKEDKILDVGCGTGRHLIPLYEKGYEVSGFDFSAEMLDQLKAKNSSIKIIWGDFLRYNFSKENKYDLVICFWNAICEICKSAEQLKVFFDQTKKLLNLNGKILLNFDDLDNINPSELSYSDVIEDMGKKYAINWNVLEYNKEKEQTISEEKIIETDINSGQSTTSKALITQKWWRRGDVIEIAKGYGFESKEFKLDGIDEVYLLLE